MRIIISPAKKMVVDTDSFAVDGLPISLEKTERLKTALHGMSPAELRTLWKCNDAIARLNIERLSAMELRRRLTPAILSYEGIQYQYMAPRVMETAQLDYLREHLRILSGFYGLLRPFVGVTPLPAGNAGQAAGGRLPGSVRILGGALAQPLAAETDFVLNLASKEYSRAVEPPSAQVHPLPHLRLRIDNHVLPLV